MRTNIEYIILSVSVKKTKSGSPYATLKVQSLEDVSSINVWNVTKTTFKVGQICSFSNIKEKEGFFSCTSQDVQRHSSNPELQGLLPKPVSLEEWSSLFTKLCTLLSSSEEVSFLQTYSSKLYQTYSKCTAAKSNHHNFVGGLATHTYETLNMFYALYPSLPFQVNPFVVIVSLLFHDWGKQAEYDQSTFDYLPPMFYQGHSFLGAEAVGQCLRPSFPASIIQQIQHCILSHHGRLEFGAPVLPCNQEAFLVAKLDELSGIGVQYANALNGDKVQSATICH